VLETTINLTREDAFSEAIECRGKSTVSIQVLPTAWGNAVVGIEWTLSDSEEIYKWVKLDPQRNVSSTGSLAAGAKGIPIFGAKKVRVVTTTADGSADGSAIVVISVL
jgi:hypothetical protein